MDFVFYFVIAPITIYVGVITFIDIYKDNKRYHKDIL